MVYGLFGKCTECGGFGEWLSSRCVYLCEACGKPFRQPPVIHNREKVDYVAPVLPPRTSPLKLNPKYKLVSEEKPREFDAFKHDLEPDMPISKKYLRGAGNQGMAGDPASPLMGSTSRLWR